MGFNYFRLLENFKFFNVLGMALFLSSNCFTLMFMKMSWNIKKILKLFHFMKLKNYQRFHLQACNPFDFLLTLKEIDKDENHPLWMSYEKYKQSSKSPLDTRLFLYCHLRLLELFRGDGFTYDQKGERGIKEFILPNQKCALLGDNYKFVPVKVELPK